MRSHLFQDKSIDLISTPHIVLNLRWGMILQGLQSPPGSIFVCEALVAMSGRNRLPVRLWPWSTTANPFFKDCNFSIRKFTARRHFKGLETNGL